MKINLESCIVTEMKMFLAIGRTPHWLTGMIEQKIRISTISTQNPALAYRNDKAEN